MKLHEALRRAVREAGVSVLKDRKLLFLLSDYRAFDEYPAMRQVMKAVADGGYGKELYRLSWGGSGSAEYQGYAESLRKTLAAEKGFREEFADYAVNSVSFALGFVSAVQEPRDHGFDPRGGSSRQEEAGACRGAAAALKSQESAHQDDREMPPESPAAIHMHDRADAVSAGSARSGLNAQPRQGTAPEEGRNMAREPWEEAADTGNSGKSTKAAKAAGTADAPALENEEDESVTPGISRRATGALTGVFCGVLLWVMVMAAAGMQAGSPYVPLLLFLFVIAGAFAGWCIATGSGAKAAKAAGAAGAAAPQNDEDESVATGMSSSASGAVAGVFGGVLLWVIVMDGAGMQAGSPSVPLLLFLFVIAGAFAGWLFSGGPGRRGHESADDGEAASHSGDSAAENEQNVRH